MREASLIFFLLGVGVGTELYRLELYIIYRVISIVQSSVVRERRI